MVVVVVVVFSRCDKAHKWLISPAGWRRLLPLLSSSDGPSPSLFVSVFVSVDGCIHKAAGSCLYDECHSLNGCETSKAKITCGYDLPARCEYLQIVCYVCMCRRVVPSLLLHHLTLANIKIQWETQHKWNICCPALIYIFLQFYSLRLPHLFILTRSHAAQHWHCAEFFFFWGWPRFCD